MRILQICSYLYPALTYGGPAKMVYDLSVELSKNNQVTIYTTDVWDVNRRISKNEKLKSSDRLVIKYFPNIFNSLAFKMRFFTGFKMIVDFIKNYQKYDLVHFHDIFILPQLLMILVAIILKVPFFVTPHGILDPIRLEKKTFIKKTLMPLVNFCLKNSKAIIAVSQKEASDLKTLGFNNIELVWNGVPLLKVKPSTRFKKYKNKSKLTLLYIGKIHPQKGLREALVALSKSKLSAQFLIAGPDDGGKKELVEMIDLLKLSNVRFLGFVNDKEKKELYQLSNVFIHPSYAEGFSISILEAMQEGLAVIINEGCNFPDVESNEAGYITKSNRLELELIKVFDNLLKMSNKKILEFGKNGAKLIKTKYSASKMATNNFNIYEKFI